MSDFDSQLEVRMEKKFELEWCEKYYKLKYIKFIN